MFDVRYTPDCGAKADIAGGPSCADAVAKVVEATTGARIESDLLVQRIEVALLFTVANQCCAPELAKILLQQYLP